MAAAFLGAVWGLRSKYLQCHCTKRKTAVFLLFLQVWPRLMKTMKKKSRGVAALETKRFICLSWKQYLEHCFLLVQTHIGRIRAGSGGNQEETGGRKREEEATCSSASLSHSRNLSEQETMANIKILKSSLRFTKSLKTLANFLSLFIFKANLPNQLLITGSFILTWIPDIVFQASMKTSGALAVSN